MIHLKSRALSFAVKVQNKTSVSFKRRIALILMFSLVLSIVFYYFMNHLSEVHTKIVDSQIKALTIDSKQSRVRFAIKAVNVCIAATKSNDKNADYYCDFAIQKYSLNYPEVFNKQKAEVIKLKAYYKMMLDLESYYSFISPSEANTQEQPVEIELLNFFGTTLGFISIFVGIIVLYILFILLINGYIKIEPKKTTLSQFQQRKNGVSTK